MAQDDYDEMDWVVRIGGIAVERRFYSSWDAVAFAEYFVPDSSDIEVHLAELGAKASAYLACAEDTWGHSAEDSVLHEWNKFLSLTPDEWSKTGG